MSSSSDNDFEIIKPSVNLRQKTGAVTVDMDAIKRADAHLANLANEYIFWVESDLQKLRDRLGEAMADAANRPEHLEALFQVAHDMRGQGTTFGYAFVSQICDVLCRYLDRVKAAGEQPEMTIVAAHIDALRAIITNRVAGENDPIGQELVRGLQIATTKKR